MSNLDTEIWDFAVIGAGICGLSLSALLVNDGYKVLILEKANILGGRARVIEKEGYRLDFGIHTVRFGKKSALAKTLETIRNKEQNPVEFQELNTSYFFLESKKPSHWEILPTGLSGMTKGHYFKLMKIGKLLLKISTVKKEKNLERSVQDWIKSHKLNEPSLLYLKLITASMQVCPFLDRASLGELRRNLAEVVKKRISVSYPLGGWKLIFERLIEKINKGRGKIITDRCVEEIIVEKEKAVKIKAKNNLYQAKKVVIAVPVQEIFEFFDKNLVDSEFLNACKNLGPTGGLSLDIALKARISEGKGLFYFDDPLSFGFFTSNLDPSCAPKGKQLFTICSPCDVDNLTDPAFRDNLLRSLKEKLFKGFPDMEKNIEFERPLFTLFDGAEVNVHQYQERRPDFKISPLENLYLVGDSTAGKGAGGDIGHNSVWNTYSRIKRDLRD